MEKFVPYEKLSKKKKKELNAKRRKSRGAVSPVTRKPQDPKAYNRKKTRRRDPEDFNGVSFFILLLYRAPQVYPFDSFR